MRGNFFEAEVHIVDIECGEVQAVDTHPFAEFFVSSSFFFLNSAISFPLVVVVVAFNDSEPFTPVLLVVIQGLNFYLFTSPIILYAAMPTHSLMPKQEAFKSLLFGRKEERPRITGSVSRPLGKG